MRLDNSLQLIPGTFGMNVPNTCTVVFIAGKYQKLDFVCIPCWHTSHDIFLPLLGKYLDRVDKVMIMVENITEDISQMPIAAFIFKDNESDEVYYSSEIRLGSFNNDLQLKIVDIIVGTACHLLW